MLCTACLLPLLTPSLSGLCLLESTKNNNRIKKKSQFITFVLCTLLHLKLLYVYDTSSYVQAC